MKRPSDRDADIDYETLKRLLMTPVVRTVNIAQEYFGQGRPAKEIAEKWGTSEGSVRKTIRRVRHILAKNNSTKGYGSDVFPECKC